MGVYVRTAAYFVGGNHNTTVIYFYKLIEIFSEIMTDEAALLAGVIGVDER